MRWRPGGGRQYIGDLNQAGAVKTPHNLHSGGSNRGNGTSSIAITVRAIEKVPKLFAVRQQGTAPNRVEVSTLRFHGGYKGTLLVNGPRFSSHMCARQSSMYPSNTVASGGGRKGGRGKRSSGLWTKGSKVVDNSMVWRQGSASH